MYEPSLLDRKRSISPAGVLKITDLESKSDLAPESVTDRTPRRARLWLRFAIMWLIGLGIVYWLFSRTDMAEVGQVLSQADYFWLVLGVAGNLFSPLLRAERFRSYYELPGHRLVVAGCQAQYGLLKSLLSIGLGDYIVLRMLNSRGAITSIAEALPRWIVLRLSDKVAVFAMVTVTASWIPSDPAIDEYVNLARWSAGAACVLICLGMFVLRKVPPAGEAAKPGLIGKRMWELHRGLNGLHQPGALTRMLSWSLVLWGWQAVCMVLLLRAFPLELGYVQLWSVAMVLLAVAVLPINAPLGIGTHHAFLVGTLTALGVSPAMALAAAIGVHAAILLTMILQAAMGSLLLAWSDHSEFEKSEINEPLPTSR